MKTMSALGAFALISLLALTGCQPPVAAGTTTTVPATGIRLVSSMGASPGLIYLDLVPGDGSPLALTSASGLWIGALVTPADSTDTVVWTCSDPTVTLATSEPVIPPVPAALVASRAIAPRPAPATVTPTSTRYVSVSANPKDILTVTVTAGGVSTLFQIGPRNME